MPVRLYIRTRARLLRGRSHAATAADHSTRRGLTRSSVLTDAVSAPIASAYPSRRALRRQGRPNVERNARLSPLCLPDGCYLRSPPKIALDGRPAYRLDRRIGAAPESLSARKQFHARG